MGLARVVGEMPTSRSAIIADGTIWQLLSEFWLMGRDIIPGFDTFYPIGLTNFFETDVRISPSATPVLCDGIYYTGFPRAADAPPSGLFYGGNDGNTGNSLSWICVPRHGNRPSKAPLTWLSNK